MADCDYEEMDLLELAVTAAEVHTVLGLAVGCQEAVDSRGQGIPGMLRSMEDRHF